MMAFVRSMLWLSFLVGFGLTDWRPAVAGTAQPQETGFVEAVLTDDDGEHRYTLFVPEEYSADQQWPIIVYLHGAGERGRDGKLPATTGPGPYIRDHQDEFPFLVLFPQCEREDSRLLTGWQAGSTDADRMLRILDDVENAYSVDPEKRILSGWSMGGYGVWSVAAATPDRWSAIIPVSGGGDPSQIETLTAVPVWSICGARDNVIRPSASGAMTDALLKLNAAPRSTVVPAAGHDVWKVAYGSKQLYDWMLNPTNDGLAPRFSDQLALQQDTRREFTPVLEIPGAAEVRLGNRLLRGLSYAIPSRVPSSALSGSIPDIYDRTSAEGHWFNVTFSRISYSAQLVQASVKAVGKDRLQLGFGLSNVRLVLGNTYVRGSGRSAVAGPVTISIGTRRPVWLNVVVQPYADQRQLKLRTVSSSFRIDSDNWSVGSPWGVSTRGLGMNRQRVANSIVRGLYGKKQRIEREVSAAVPSIMQWAEETLDISDAGQGVAAIWPLPVYEPNVRVWPEAVRTDEQGATILLGMAADAPTIQTLPFRRAAITPLRMSTDSVDDTLTLKVNPAAVKPLSQLLVESDAARINVLDIPGESFFPLVTRDRLLDVIPVLADYPPEVQIQTELVLREPFEFSAAESAAEADSDANSGVLTLLAPRLTAIISLRESTSSEDWTTVAEFEFRIEQQVRAAVSELRDASDLRLIPNDDPRLVVTSGRLMTPTESDSQPSQNERFQSLLVDGWNDWINGQSFADTVIADLDFQKTRLRLLNINFAPQSVAADFEILPISIHNLADEPLEYQLKGPLTAWSKTHSLPPGETHKYDVDYSMTWRRNGPDGPIVYTLKPGSHSEFRNPLIGGAPRLFAR